MSPRKILALIVAGSILTQGYLVGQINHGFQLALIRQFAGETAWQNDAFLQGMARTYTTVFFPALGFLARGIPLSVLLLALFVILRTSSVVLSYRLALELFRDETIALWTAAATSVHLLTFAMDIVSENYLTHGALAQVMTLGALLLFAQKRIVAAFGLAGLMFNAHGMHATHLIGVMGVATLAGKDRRSDLFALVKAAPICILAASPTIAWMWKEGVLFAAVPDPARYVDAIKSWFPTHFWPSTWSLTDWVAFLFPALAAWPLGRIAGPAEDRGRTGLIAVLSIALGMLGGIATEIHASPFLIRLHPMRLSFIACLAGAPYFAAAAVRLLHPPPGHPSPRASVSLGIFLLLGIAMPLPYRWDYWITLIFALFGMAALSGDRPRSRAIELAAPLTLLLAPAVPILLAWSANVEVSAGSHGLRFFLIEGSVGFIAAVSFASARWTEKKGAATPRERKLTIGLAAAIASIHLALNGYAILKYGWLGGGLERWREVQSWCGDHLEPGERVLVPLTEIGLRAFSRQTPAVDFQEGDILFHDPPYMDKFFDKLRLYGWSPGRPTGWEFVSRLDALDDALTESDLLRIGGALEARVGIRRKRNPRLTLPVLFENSDFVVYALDGRPR